MIILSVPTEVLSGIGMKKINDSGKTAGCYF